MIFVKTKYIILKKPLLYYFNVMQKVLPADVSSFRSVDDLIEVYRKWLSLQSETNIIIIIINYIMYVYIGHHTTLSFWYEQANENPKNKKVNFHCLNLTTFSDGPERF